MKRPYQGHFEWHPFALFLFQLHLVSAVEGHPILGQPFLQADQKAQWSFHWLFLSSCRRCQSRPWIQWCYHLEMERVDRRHSFPLFGVHDASGCSDLVGPNQS